MDVTGEKNSPVQSLRIDLDDTEAIQNSVLAEHRAELGCWQNVVFCFLQSKT